MAIRARETGLPVEALTKRGKGSYLVAGRIGEAPAKDSTDA